MLVQIHILKVVGVVQEEVDTVLKRNEHTGRSKNGKQRPTATTNVSLAEGARQQVPTVGY